MRNTTWYYLPRPLLESNEKEAGQQLAEGVSLAHSTQVMEIQDMDYEINELGQIKKGYRGLQVVLWRIRSFAKRL